MFRVSRHLLILSILSKIMWIQIEKKYCLCCFKSKQFCIFIPVSLLSICLRLLNGTWLILIKVKALPQCLGFAAEYVSPVIVIHCLWFSGGTVLPLTWYRGDLHQLRIRQAGVVLWASAVFVKFYMFLNCKNSRASSFYHCFTLLRLRKCGIMHTHFSYIYMVEKNRYVRFLNLIFLTASAAFGVKFWFTYY